MKLALFAIIKFIFPHTQKIVIMSFAFAAFLDGLIKKRNALYAGFL
jgi:hypothetical protein